MKRKILILLFVSAVFGQACTGWVDLEPENSVTYTNYFKNETDIADLTRAMLQRIKSLERGVNTSIPETLGWISDTIRTNEAWKIAWMDPQTYRNNSDWGGFYGAIYAANFILDNRYRAEENGVAADRLDFYGMQANFVKGYAYMRIAQLWGEAPIIASSSDVGLHAKSSPQDLLKQAETFALKAMELPVFADMIDDDGARITNLHWAGKGAAAALLANIYAWRGYLDNDQEAWASAEEYCRKIIDGETGFYDLEESITRLCERLGDNTGNHGVETIWALSYKLESDNTTKSNLFNPYFIFNMYGHPYVQSLDYNQLPLYITNASMIADDMFDEGDPRIDNFFYEYIRQVGPPSNWRQYLFVDKWKNNIVVRDPTNAGDPLVFVGIDVNRVVWRLADIYLLRGEARARQGKANAVDDLNQIRRRAGIADYDPAEGDLQYAIFKERKRELLYEGHYFFDAIRNGYWREMSPGYAALTDQDVANGALYMPVPIAAFANNPVMTQNIYWHARL